MLEPRPVGRGVEDRMAYLPFAQFLGSGRRAEEGIDLAIDEEFGRATLLSDPVDVVGGIKPDIGSHQNQQHVRVVIERAYSHPLATQILNTADAFVRDQFETTGVQARKYLDREACL